ncbi:hypothetical protein, partial [Xanthomonas phaseoli]|uniref:hypothetical protein n=5 Tax=Xanthomonas phaseoli TaxID=1985254 RepID=UPI001EE63DAF
MRPIAARSGSQSLMRSARVGRSVQPIDAVVSDGDWHAADDAIRRLAVAALGFRYRAIRTASADAGRGRKSTRL